MVGVLSGTGMAVETDESDSTGDVFAGVGVLAKHRADNAVYKAKYFASTRHSHVFH